MKMCKILNSRKAWKEKAKRRGYRVRVLQKVAKLDKQRIADNRQEIQRLESEVALLHAEIKNRKMPVGGNVVIQHKTLSVLIVVCGIVSFRSVPRILQIFKPLLQSRLRIPHFTSVINWTLRVGVDIFQRVTTIAQPWLAIIDCSIDIGTRKALIVLRVPISALQDKQGAINPQDCECIGLEVSHKWNGQLVSNALTNIFNKTGTPIAIIKDGGADLNKGVALLCSQNPEHKIYTIEDIGHFAANALKALFDNSTAFTKFRQVVYTLANEIRQTPFAWLLPPKIRSKGRFQGITRVANWAKKILQLFETNNNLTLEHDLNKARQIFAKLIKLRRFLNIFCHTCSIVELFLKIMKTSGLNEDSYLAAKNILAKLSHTSLVHSRLSDWLDRHIDIHRALSIGTKPLLVSSDAIESLFGLFKTVIQRNPQAELNRLVYILPLLCGHFSYVNIENALNNCSHSQMCFNINNSIPPTLRQFRIQNLKNTSESVPKTGNDKPLNSG